VKPAGWSATGGAASPAGWPRISRAQQDPGSRFARASEARNSGTRPPYRFADFPFAKLQGADFRDAGIARADFLSADLRGARFRGARIEHADFTSADLRRADFSVTENLHVTFGFACLTGTKFAKAVFVWAAFPGAQGVGVNFSHASLDHVSFTPLKDAPINEVYGATTPLTAINFTGVEREALRLPADWHAQGLPMSALKRRCSAAAY
jgi:uncharacterized protein YjbI with pentapeptide repeats